MQTELVANFSQSVNQWNTATLVQSVPLKLLQEGKQTELEFFGEFINAISEINLEQRKRVYYLLDVLIEKIIIVHHCTSWPCLDLVERITQLKKRLFLDHYSCLKEKTEYYLERGCHTLVISDEYCEKIDDFAIIDLTNHLDKQLIFPRVIKNLAKCTRITEKTINLLAIKYRSLDFIESLKENSYHVEFFLRKVLMCINNMPMRVEYNFIKEKMFMLVSHLETTQTTQDIKYMCQKIRNEIILRTEHKNQIFGDTLLLYAADTLSVSINYFLHRYDPLKRLKKVSLVNNGYVRTVDIKRVRLLLKRQVYFSQFFHKDAILQLKNDPNYKMDPFTFELLVGDSELIKRYCKGNFTLDITSDKLEQLVEALYPTINLIIPLDQVRNEIRYLKIRRLMGF